MCKVLFQGPFYYFTSLLTELTSQVEKNLKYLIGMGAVVCDRVGNKKTTRWWVVFCCS